jgi:hypothetical protein
VVLVKQIDTTHGGIRATKRVHGPDNRIDLLISPPLIASTSFL